MSGPDRSDAVWKRAEIDSPCVKLCVIHPKAKICTGCFRTLDEIGSWGSFTPETRREIMAGLKDREGLLKQRRGGRAGRLGSRDET